MQNYKPYQLLPQKYHRNMPGTVKTQVSQKVKDFAIHFVARNSIKHLISYKVLCYNVRLRRQHFINGGKTNEQ